MPPNYLEVWLSGRNLNAQQVIALEQKLLVDPTDHLSRIALMGYYPKPAIWKRAAREKAFGHELWFIRNEPTHPALRFPECSLIACADDDLYEIGKSAWLEHVDDDCVDVTILSHATWFFYMRDKQKAAELIERARVIEPHNQEHLEDLASLYSLGLNGDYDRSWLQRAFEVHTELLASKPDDVRLLAEFASVAEKVGEYDLSREAALKILQVVKPTDRAAIHQAHSVLGLIYLHTGDVDSAKAELLLSGNWPEFDLDNALIRRGETKAVCDHLWRSMTAWKLGRIQLFAWLLQLWLGDKPNLRPTMLMSYEINGFV